MFSAKLWWIENILCISGLEQISDKSGRPHCSKGWVLRRAAGVPGICGENYKAAPGIIVILNVMAKENIATWHFADLENDMGDISFQEGILLKNLVPRWVGKCHSLRPFVAPGKVFCRRKVIKTHYRIYCVRHHGIYKSKVC
ncbi:hypothetical protein LSM04_008347 [Trypanosoma melophagium]|uniref:uncharacterized protein n=1 Tax=Trypanosoma melophagium TaxID=715481 RepID=UPI00351A8260|nr:hypothetical protein LSM04_008347 [Trypanosoma melophagium]